MCVCVCVRASVVCVQVWCVCKCGVCASVVCVQVWCVCVCVCVSLLMHEPHTKQTIEMRLQHTDLSMFSFEDNIEIVVNSFENNISATMVR